MTAIVMCAIMCATAVVAIIAICNQNAPRRAHQVRMAEIEASTQQALSMDEVRKAELGVSQRQPDTGGW